MIGQPSPRVLVRSPLSRVARGALAALVALGAVSCADEGPPPGEQTAESASPITCVTLRRGGAGLVEDAHIVSDPIDPSKAGLSFGAVPVLNVGTVSTSTLRSLVQFDLSVIPPNVVVASATLTMVKAQSLGLGTVALHRVLVPWTEGSVSWNVIGSSFDAAVEASIDSAVVPNGAVSLDLTPLVASWVSGASANHGVLLEQTGTGRTSFGSSEASALTARPRLSICYAPTSCANGVQNGAETGVDCGGPCVPCANPCVNVVCAPSDACHVAGTCNALTGLCSNPPAPPGTACDDGSACTVGDVCGGGVCAGAALPTDDGDACTTDTCDPASGAVHTAQACCADGAQNQGEDGVDCGGPCAACALPTGCDAILAAGGAGDGIYTVDPDGPGGAAPVSVHCDMTTDGGGWTLVARASDTNGVGGDYEFRAAMGQHSLLGTTFSGGAVGDPQYTLALDAVWPAAQGAVDLQYYCYDATNKAATAYWSKVKAVDATALKSSLGAANPDFLSSPVSIENADGVISDTGLYGFFGREMTGTAQCGNIFAGQSGIKFSCQSGQAVMSPKSVWYLTHYTGDFTEVSSCGSHGGAVLPYFVGEVRLRAHAPGCADDLLNGAETNIDCGGPSCAPCPDASCADVLAHDPLAPDGYHAIDVDGAGPHGQPAQALYCDMTSDGGGWTLIARASDTNGTPGDYEFRAAMGATHSLVGTSFSGGTAASPQYTLGLDAAIERGQTTLDLQYYCYDTRQKTSTAYWSKVVGLDIASLTTSLAAPNPDFLLSPVRVENADGITSSAANYAFFGRESSGAATCGNGFAGQSGIKFSCGQSGQTAMSPASVWYLTHYAGAYTEVTSCGPVGASSMPYYAGEVRFRYRGAGCADGAQGGSESAVDCGGSCPPCSDGQACALASDCANDVCVAGTCQAATCADGARNGLETGIDCGGPACGACADGGGCSDAFDCTSGVCTAGYCEAPSCADGTLNGGESGLDCGGPCPACAPSSCADVLAMGLSLGDGIYQVDPDLGGPALPVAVSCDMTADGGGWTLVARASDTNGLGGDYEFRAAVGQHSLLGTSFSSGTPASPQYTVALPTVIPQGATTVDLQYYCYDATNKAATVYWTKAKDIVVASFEGLLSAANPDFLLTPVTLVNADGVTTASGHYAFFGRESVGGASCGNGVAGQSGMKPSCSQSGQGVLSPKGVWYLTHYTGNYTEVTSCGPNAGSVLPNYVGEVRFR